MPAAAPAAPPPPAAPKPSAAAPPARSSAGAPPAEKPPEDFMSEAGAELDALADETPPPKPAAKAADKPATEIKPPEGSKPTEKGSETPPEEPPTPVRAKELREAYETLKKETREVLKPALKKAEARVKELEATKPVDLAPLQEKLTATEKRNQELESAIQYLDYEQSSEFKDKYAAPYLEAWNRAVADFSQLTVRVPTGETDETTGQPKFSTRAATNNDLLALANMPLSEMDAAAEEMFGRSAARVIRHVEKIRELAEAQEKAKTEAKTKAGKLAETRKLETVAQTQARQKLWQESNTALATKYPNWFAPVEGDAEGNTLLEKGFALADRLFAPTAETAPKTPEETVRLHALIRNKIANHDRMALRLKTAKARIAELEESLKQFEDSEPGGGAGGHRTPAASSADPLEDANAEIDRLDVVR